MADKQTEKKFKDDIRTEAWHYFKAKNLRLYIISNPGFASYKSLYAISDDPQKFATMKQKEKGYPSNCNRPEDFVAAFNHYSQAFTPNLLLSESEDQIEHTDFFNHCYQKFPQHQKLLLSFYQQFHKDKSISTTDFFFSVVDLLASTKQEKIKLIQKFSIATLDIRHIGLTSLEQYLTKNGTTREEFDKFLVAYLKARKNQLNDSKWGVIVRDYLLERFNHNSEKLKPFTEFFSFLKALYEIPKADFLINEEPLSTIAVISCKKMKKSFLLDNWEINDYCYAFKPITQGFKNHFNLSRVEIIERDRAESIYQISFYHDNPTFTKELFEKTLIEYFHHLFEQKTKFLEVNDKHFLTWIAKRDLFNDLSQMKVNEEPTKKLKV